MQQVQSTTLRNTSAASSTTILNLSGVELSTMDFDDNTPVSACSCCGTPTDETTNKSQYVVLGAIQQFAPRVSNPLTIEVPEETYDLEELSQDDFDEEANAPPNSPWPQVDEYTPQSCPPSPGDDARAAFERASAAFDQAKPRWEMISREEGWKKEAPSKLEYEGKRNKNGMPDKRSAAGKAWYQKQREEELKAALRKVLNRHSIQKK